MANEPRGGPLYKIVSRADWEAADGELPWAAIDRRDGFVHLSAAHQVRETARRHFADRDDLVLVEVDPTRLSADTLRWEASRGGALFPHVYGDVPPAALGPVTALATKPELSVSPHVPEPLGPRPSPEAVARRFELAEAAAMIAFADAAPSARATVRGAAVATQFGPGSPLDAVKGWGLDGERATSRADLEAFEAWFEDGSHAVEVSSHAVPGALAELAGRGYRAEAIENVLVRDLGAPLVPDPAVRLEPVEGDQAVAWDRLVARAFADGTPNLVRPLDLSPIALAHQGRAFFVVMNGERVGGCAMRIEHEVALLMASAVLPDHRGRGAHAGALAHRLALASRAGCTWAKIDVEPGSAAHRNAHRAGFRLAYVRVAFRKS